MDLAKWISGSGSAEWASSDMEWLLVTAALSVLLVTAYAVIMFNWYFQSRMGLSIESRASLRRLVYMVLCCAACGTSLYLAETGWVVWRMYDLVLLLLVIYAWSFALRSRGMGHVTEKLSQFVELERTCARYTEIAELLPQMVWTANSDGRIDYSNKRWLDYAGAGVVWCDTIHPDEQRDVRDWWSTLRAGRCAGSREIRLKGKEGYRTFLLSATPIVHRDAIKWLGACADIEAQKRLALEKELQAKEKAFFLNALSHDLRAPLNNVVLNAQLMQMMSVNAEMNESATIIVDNAIAASNLMSQLLEYARSGTEKSTTCEVCLSTLLRQVERRFAPLVAEKGLSIRVFDEGAPSVILDRVKLDRILSNLVDNAIKFTSSGGIVLSVTNESQQVRIEVTDTGPGVPERHVGNLFNEFYQVGNNERDRRKGFGLGLAICKQLARQIGGDIRLARTSSDGSSFEITLPQTCHGRGGRPSGAPSHGDALADARLCVA